MAERIWEWGELTPQVVRAWGYEADLILLEQDEDLLLADVEYFPVLLELAGDEECPKKDYAFCILCEYCREQITRGGKQGVARIRAAWSAIQAPAVGRPAEWHRFIGRLLGYTQPSGPVSKEVAEQMANDLLLGIADRIGKVVEEKPSRIDIWRFTLRTSVTEHIDVCISTGAFSYAHYY